MDNVSFSPSLFWEFPKFDSIQLLMSQIPSVTLEDTFEAMVRLHKEGYRPVALDFASASNPGGGWRKGQQGTQEESLCKRSNLGELLETRKYPLAPNTVLYVPGVKLKPPLGTSMPTCAVIASELHAIAASSQQYLLGRVESLYHEAQRHGHDAIVLGAWGCGAFRETEEDAEILAKIFKTIAKRYPNIKPVYAMCRPGRNYQCFLRILN